MKNIIFIAPPAAGKGTQSKLLIEHYDYNHISIGDLLRKEVSNNGPLASEIDNIIKSGSLVSNDIVTQIFESELTNAKGPFIFDGYPRNIEQAKDLERILTNLNIDSNIAIYLDIDEEEAVLRATGRLICPKCNLTYNINNAEMKPKVTNKCDVCKVDLTSRSDDNIEAYKERYQIFTNETLPLMSFYEEKGILKTIKNPNNPDYTFSKIEELIR